VSFLFATSTAAAVGYAIVLYALVFVPAALTALKGHGVWLLGGIIMPLIWWYSAIRLALPGSWWERHRYGPDKQLAARERYGDRTAEPWLIALAGILLTLPFVLGFVTGLLVE
jgi:uncharacterized membrane protein YdfJ with MMPL/SSD domain